MKNKILALITLVNFSAFSQTQGNLSHNGMAYVMHDSTQCSSNIGVDHFVDKANSFLNDEVKVIDHGGNLIYSEINMAGDLYWSFMLNIQDFDWVPDYFIESNYLTHVVPSFQVLKIISGVDTVYLDETFVSEYIPDPCSYQSVSGKTYIDNNGDCTFNSGDVGVGNYNPSFNVNVSNGTGSSPVQYNTNINGDYSAMIQESYFNNLTVAVNPLYEFIFPNDGCAPYSYSINSLPQTGVDFVLQCADIDVRVNSANSVARPTIPFMLFPSVTNFGCDSVSGTLNLVLDPNVTYDAVNSSSPADVVAGDTLKWFYSNLTNVSNGAYWQSLVGGIQLTPAATLFAGDIISFELFTEVPTNDIDGSNNSKSIDIVLVNSYDPNYKEVVPAGAGAPGYISESTDLLTYTIHFQNTGNAPALNINIVDSLEANVIPSTLRILNSSHAMVPEWIDNSILKFNFANINLADSVSNEPASHGYVTFEIDMVQGLNSGDEIKNRAYIYFDNNVPVITDYALNTIEYLSVDENEERLNSILFPNPTHGITTVKLNNFSGEAYFTLLDVTGKLVFSQIINKNEAELNTESLESGVYFYSINTSSTNEIVNGKLIVE